MPSLTTIHARAHSVLTRISHCQIQQVVGLPWEEVVGADLGTDLESRH